MATLLTVSVLIASGSVSACAAYAYRRWKRTQPNTSRGGSGQRGSLPSYQSIGATPRRGVLKNGQSNAGTSSQGRTVTGRLFIVPAGCRIPTAGEECIICRDEPHYFPKNAPTPRCKHAAKVCFDCLKRTVKETVNAGYFDTDGHIVRCPNDTCNEWMSHSDVMTWADVETFERYERLVKLASGDPKDAMRCLSSNCNGVMKQKGKLTGTTPVAICQKCGRKQCTRHQSDWHEGFTCKQWDKRKIVQDKKNDSLSGDWITKNTKACPNRKCGRRIQKSDGCDHFTCKKPAGCGHQFCWLCLAPWDDIRKYDNSKHYDHCKYYSGKPNGHPAPSSAHAQRRWWQTWRKTR